MLEIGAGSGYVCAILAALGCEVIGVEIVPELAVSAGKAIDNLGFSKNISFNSDRSDA